MAKNILIFLGPQGSGKSTQAEIIAKEKKYVHITESDLLHEFVKKNNKESKMVKEMMKKGEMVPFEITCKITFEKIDKIKSKNIILDGFPRLLDQTHVLDYYIYKENHNFLGIVYIDLPKKECVKRLLLRKREDDTLKVINTRLKIYFEKTKKVLDHYQEKNKLIKINGNQVIKKVTKEIINKLKNIV
jgi:adenylate kinase